MTHATASPFAATVEILLGSFPIGDPGGLHRSIREARRGDPGALDALLDDVRRAAREAWPDVSDGLVVPVPGHLAGGATALVRSIAVAIADTRGWQLAPDGLVRVHDVAEAKSAGLRMESESTSLEWHGDERGDVVVLVDDVMRSGATIQACLAAIRTAGDGRPVVAVAVAEARHA